MSKGPLIRGISPATEALIYKYLFIGIIWSLVFWTLANSLCCVLLCGFWLFCSPKEFNLHAKRSKFVLLFASLYLVILIGMAYTQNVPEGLRKVEEKVPMLFFPLILGTTSFLTEKLMRQLFAHLLLAIVLACLAGLGYGAWQYLQTGSLDMLTDTNIVIFPDQYPYTMALFCLLGLIVLFFMPAFMKDRKGLRILVAVILSLFVILLNKRLMTGCWLGIFIIFCAGCLPGIRARIIAVAVLAGAAVILIASVPSMHNRWIELIDFSDHNTIQLDQDASLARSWGGKSIRQAIWKCSADVIGRHWAVGVGTGDTQDSLQQAYEDRKFYFASRYNTFNTHNQYLQILVSNGIYGLGILLACILVPLALCRGGASGSCYTLFLLLLAVAGFSEVLLDINKGIIWYSLFNSIFAFAGTAGLTLTQNKQSPIP